MSRRIEVSADTLDAALRRAVADLLDCPEDKVDLRVDGPGIDEVAGTFRLEVAVAGPGRDDRDGTDSAGREERDEPELVTPEQLDEEADAAADFLEGLLDALELPGDLRIRVQEDHAEVEVVEIGSGALIGRRGQTLEAIQELVRCALQREFQRRSRVKIDAEGYRSRRLEKLLEKAEEAIEDVLDTGESVRLEPMDVFERKAVHHLVAERGGVSSRSQGREPARRVIIELDE
ncbi:MAG TPA: R3H domain-containing nucleic acid-binding protein [Egicoccus sp.]|nr:R3H domain-containing nucleic acid-binding protein [Egicoccus sp.]HSK24352.1 R3H domain-containing nucleic acid-binding protein [Egicoccus sp.]